MAVLHGPLALVAATAAVSGFLHLDQVEAAAGSTADLSGYTSQARADAINIDELPGLDYDPGFRQFSGYLPVDDDHGRHLFYWYVESQGVPTDDPVVLWTNGGPGCSGLLGFGTEMGPYFISRDGTLSPNPFSWNKVASVLYIEQPAGTGFSYSDTEADYTTGEMPFPTTCTCLRTG